MTDNFIDITQPLDPAQKKLKIIDNGDGTYSMSASVINGLVREPYDYILCSYTGSNLTGVVYKSGGASGTVVATLTLAYSGSDLISVTKT